ncbi:MAG: RNA-binding protein [Candidatus Wildermuthbacteria bacterium]|nr:RNA-binding protein [Candidatus Wildermuthbacteria bacterium]MBI2121141.1 RNA-binding protein [Candidatus Wildermuthbacteria bacterium]MBI2647894.1 RNA-binding protein [Candidatus Wildermuthbacteria bacterium]
MNKRLYVGGLNFRTTEAELRAKFEEAGAVESAMILSDKMTGRSRGFGFVEMATVEEAAKAIEMFNGKEFDGRPLTVNEAKEKTER